MFIGCGLGSAAMPPLSGFLFTSSLGPNSILYLNLLIVATISVISASMWFVSRFRVAVEETEMVGRKEDEA